MIDAKEIGKRVANEMYRSDGKSRCLADVVAEEIEKAQRPRTRSEEVAERWVRTQWREDDENEVVVFGHNPPLIISEPGASKTNFRDVVRMYLASLINEERADAARQERERIVNLVKETDRG